MLCPLCKSIVETFHKRSHTLPEWMYKDCYDKNHKILKVSRSEQNLTKKQKGHYLSFICNNCEDITQKLDHYASLILTDRSPLSPESQCVIRENARGINNDEEIEFSKWSGVDFIKLQRFVFSVILRCYFADMIQGPIALPQKHLENILQLYNNNTLVNDYSYPILLTKFRSTDKFRDLVVMPYFSKIEGHHVLNFAGGGYRFNLYVSNHSKPDFVYSLCLKSNGIVHVVMEDVKDTEMFRIFVDSMKSAKNKRKK